MFSAPLADEREYHVKALGRRRLALALSRQNRLHEAITPRDHHACR